MKSKLTLFLSILFIALHTKAQSYGDEWINYQQEYYKVYIGEEGLYRINHQSLIDAGIAVENIDPKGIQVFWRGEEQHIWVQGQEDGSFDQGDYIEFYGTYNDGKLDTELYRSPEEQPHDYMSLYQDSSVYFITWNNSLTGKRIQQQAPQSFSNLNSDPWYMHEEVMLFTNQWFDGTEYSDLGFYSEYTDGEGWMSSSVTGRYRSYTLETPLYEPNGPEAKAYVLAYGKSDPTNEGDIDPDGNNHEFEVSVGWGNSLTVLDSRKHRGYSKLEFKDLSIPPALLSKKTRLNFISKFGAQGRHAVSLIKITYPRKFDLQQSAQKTYIANSSNSYYQWSNYLSSGQNPIVYDLVNNERLFARVNGNVLEYKRSDNDSGLLVISDSVQVPIISELRSVKFNPYDFSNTNYDYLIISHSSLDDGAQEYKQYRESDEGGGHNVLVVHADELYDQFYYGIHHPLALRSFNLKIKREQISSPDFLLLLGRGQLYSRVTTNALARELADLVPTYGIPASDYLLAIDPQESDIKATMAIGRLPAKSNQDIRNYLQKLKEWELIMKQNHSWGKEVLHLAGGINQAENDVFQSYLRTIGRRVEKDSFSGNVTTITKEVSSIDKTLTEVIIDEINSGVSLMTYFGHGSALILEIDIGDVQQYNNFGKTPFFHFNGCVLGNTFEISSLAESFLFTENKGALGWLAGSSYGFTGELFSYSKTFYDELFLHSYGSPIGQCIQRTIEKYVNPNNQFSRSMCLQYLYHGDPALGVFTPPLPDFKFPDNAVKNNLNSRSSQEPVVLDIAFLNQGSFCRDTLEVQVNRKNISDQEESLFFKILPQRFENVLTIEFPPDAGFKGINRLDITLDPQNKIPEFGAQGENNNQLSYQFFLPTEGVQIIEPLKNQIISNSQARLTVQLDDLNSNEKTIIFQLDTTSSFNSPFLKTTRTNGNFLISADFALLPKDSIDYFWRAAIDDTEPIFESSQFAYVQGSQTGFAQSNRRSFLNGSLQNLFIDSITSQFTYGNTLSATYQFQTFGGRGLPWRNLRWGGPAVHLSNFTTNGVWVLVLDPVTEDRWVYQSDYALKQPTDAVSFGYPWLADNPYYQKDAYSGIFEFNTTVKSDRDSFLAHLKRIPDNFHIYMMNGVQTGIDDWEDTLFAELRNFGVVEMESRLQEWHPFGIKGQKGADPGSALEYYADLNDPINPPDQQSILFSTSFPVKMMSGTYTTEKIGPSLEWKESFVQAELESTDNLSIDIIGIDKNGTESVLLENVPSLADITQVDAQVHPFVKLRLNLHDSTERTPPQLKRWIVSFTPGGDASIGRKTSKTVMDTFVMGASIPFLTQFINLNHPEYRNVPIEISLNDNNGNNIFTQRDTLLELKTSDSTERIYQFSSDGLKGLYNLQLLLNPVDNPKEVNLNNNQYARPILIQENDNISPLEIKVDGRYITYRELVSSKPLIDVNWLQTDSFYFISDIEEVQLSLKYPDSDTFILLDPSVEDVTFTAATSYGEPYHVRMSKPLEKDGEYTVRAEVIAPHNQKLMKNEATFTIVSESTISEVFNYPNPFVNDTRFVFTMTGAEPVDIVIDIYNISGRKVKKITIPADELKIGENITDYRWNGTDEFGDQLANGVYLYKIHAINAEGEAIKERSVLDENARDQFFQGGFGKMYIAR